MSDGGTAIALQGGRTMVADTGSSKVVKLVLVAAGGAAISPSIVSAMVVARWLVGHWGS